MTVIKEKPIIRKRDIERFKSYLQQDGDHLIWIGAKYPNGYGTFWLNGRQWLAHKVAYFIANPEAEYRNRTTINHHCDIRACCTPEHLYSGSYQTNNRDTINRDRYRNGHEKLTKEQVSEIRFLYKIYAYAGGPEAKRALAGMYNMTYTGIDQILKFRRRASQDKKALVASLCVYLRQAIYERDIKNEPAHIESND